MEQRDLSLYDLVAAAAPAAAAHFDRKELFVFDGTDGANQCHINALMVVQCARHNVPFDRLPPEQQRFLTLNFLRSMPLGHLDNAGIKRLHEQLGISPQTKSHRDWLSGALSAALVEAKQRFFDDQLARFVSQPWERLAFVERRPLVRRNVMILPKFVGIWCLLQALKEDSAHGRPCWTVVRCQEPDRSGHLWLITPDQQAWCSPDAPAAAALDPATPVIVITAHGSAIDFTTLNPEALQLANAAAWMNTMQPMAVVPECLQSICTGMFTFARERHIGPATAAAPLFDIQHMFPDTLAHALHTEEARL
jgi:hypothetical protein